MATKQRGQSHGKIDMILSCQIDEKIKYWRSVRQTNCSFGQSPSISKDYLSEKVKIAFCLFTIETYDGLRTYS
jgi:hypothetical protein